MKEVGPKNGTIENGYCGQEERERERVKRWVQKRELCVCLGLQEQDIVCACVCVWRAREDVEKSLGSEKGVIKAI